MSCYICDELLDEIFKRLPAKSLLRVRSLSKSWCYRISSPDFIRKQTTFQSVRTSDRILIKHQISYGENFYTLHVERQLPLKSQCGYNGTTPMKFPKGDIVGSCNGILCLHDLDSDNVSLWNPSIRRQLTLPYHDLFRNNCEIVGFGFDPNTDDYKIVRLCYVRHGEQRKSLVYSLNKRVWCEITPPSTRLIAVKSHACFVNGVLYWVAVSYESNDFILTFDLTTHVFGEITLPEEPNQPTICPIIYNGSLGMFINKGCYSRIWVMKEYNNVASWYMVLNFRSLQFVGGVDAVLPLENGNFLIRNDKNVFKVGYPRGACSPLVPCMYDSSTVDMVTYVESLALLDIGTVCNANQPYFVRQKKNRLFCFDVFGLLDPVNHVQ